MKSQSFIIGRSDNMKSKNGFILLENGKDVKEWLSKQKVTRKITRLQVQNTFLPDYTTW